MSRRDLIFVHLADWIVGVWLFPSAVAMVVFVTLGQVIPSGDEIEFSPFVEGVLYFSVTLPASIAYLYLLPKYWGKTIGLYSKDRTLIPYPSSDDGNHVLRTVISLAEIYPLPIIGVLTVLPRLDSRRLSDALAGFMPIKDS